ncbi:MAG: glycoside hydrolase family 20 zincin-like fold domain-containing protein, partial [Spirochaetaceae bacterium]|nr:glycoside hydrolase family 20 zincin-like fold domain-containing protein [Spirochaetaceae bacterium]
MTQGGILDTQGVAERIIPLPKQLAVAGGRAVQPGETSIIVAFPWSPPLGKAVEALQKVLGITADDAAGAGRGKSCPCIRLEQSLPGSASYRALSVLPNADQAYQITPCHDSGGTFCGLTLSALAPAGIFYAAQTLAQAVYKTGVPGPVRDAAAGTPLVIPEITITDWPDITLRGQWGGNASYDLHNTSAYKLNAVDLGVQLTKRGEFSDINTRPSGLTARARFDQDDIASLADSLAVNISPFIPHIEQLTSRYGYPDFFDEATLAKVKNTPDPKDAAAT